MWIVGFDQTPADSKCPRWVVVELVTVEDDLGAHVEDPWCASVSQEPEAGPSSGRGSKITTAVWRERRAA